MSSEMFRPLRFARRGCLKLVLILLMPVKIPQWTRRGPKTSFLVCLAAICSAYWNWMFTCFAEPGAGHVLFLWILFSPARCPFSQAPGTQMLILCCSPPCPRDSGDIYLSAYDVFSYFPCCLGWVTPVVLCQARRFCPPSSPFCHWDHWALAFRLPDFRFHSSHSPF